MYTLFIAFFSGIMWLAFSILTIVSIMKKSNKNASLFNAITSFISAIIAVVTSLNVNLPEPSIFPLDNDSHTYTDSVNIAIKSNEDFCTIYYSLDGTDPKDGKVYTGEFDIFTSTTVCARNNFLWWWSDIVKSPFAFENINFDESENVTNKNRNTFPITRNINLAQLQIVMNDFLYKIEKTKQSSETEQPSETEQSSNSDETSQAQLPAAPTSINAGINVAEGQRLINYINQYRRESGLEELIWDTSLEKEAQDAACLFALDGTRILGGDYHIIGRQCNGAKNAQKAVSDWITGNDYIFSEVESILNPYYTQMGGALYYLPDGNEYGYHYFWIVCLR